MLGDFLWQRRPPQPLPVPPPVPEGRPQPGVLDHLMPRHPDPIVFGTWHPPAYHGIRAQQPVIDRREE